MLEERNPLGPLLIVAALLLIPLFAFTICSREEREGEPPSLKVPRGPVRASNSVRLPEPVRAGNDTRATGSAEACTNSVERGAENTIEVRVEVGREPQADVSVKAIRLLEDGKSFERHESVTGSDGVVRFRSLTSGKYTVWIRRGSLQRLVQASVSSEEGVVLTFRLSRPARIFGRLQVRGEAYAGRGFVRLERKSENGFSDCAECTMDAAGGFDFPGMDAGTYEVCGPGLLGRIVRLAEVELKPGDAVERDVVVGIPRICGCVVEEASGTPIEAAQVYTTSGVLLSQRTDREGNFIFHDLPFGIYYIGARKKGYALPAVQKVIVGPRDEPARVSFVLEPEAVIHLTALREDGRPYAGRLRLVLYEDDATSRTVIGGGVFTCNESGEATRGGFKAGLFRGEFLPADGDAGLGAEMRLSIACGEANSFCVVLRSK